jgi:hypothetical protein
MPRVCLPPLVVPQPRVRGVVFACGASVQDHNCKVSRRIAPLPACVLLPLTSDAHPTVPGASACAATSSQPAWRWRRWLRWPAAYLQVGALWAPLCSSRHALASARASPLCATRSHYSARIWVCCRAPARWRLSDGLTWRKWSRLNRPVLHICEHAPSWYAAACAATLVCWPACLCAACLCVRVPRFDHTICCAMHTSGDGKKLYGAFTVYCMYFD